MRQFGRRIIVICLSSRAERSRLWDQCKIALLSAMGQQWTDQVLLHALAVNRMAAQPIMSVNEGHFSLHEIGILEMTGQVPLTRMIELRGRHDVLLRAWAVFKTQGCECRSHLSCMFASCNSSPVTPVRQSNRIVRQVEPSAAYTILTDQPLTTHRQKPRAVCTPLDAASARNSVMRKLNR